MLNGGRMARTAIGIFSYFVAASTSCSGVNAIAVSRVNSKWSLSSNSWSSTPTYADGTSDAPW